MLSLNKLVFVVLSFSVLNSKISNCSLTLPTSNLTMNQFQQLVTQRAVVNATHFHVDSNIIAVVVDAVEYNSGIYLITFYISWNIKNSYYKSIIFIP